MLTVSGFANTAKAVPFDNTLEALTFGNTDCSDFITFRKYLVQRDGISQ